MGQILDCGCDWFRFTTKLDGQGFGPLSDVAKSLSGYFESEGEELKEFRQFGFEGVKCGKVSFGTSSTHAMLNVSGQTAKVAIDLVKAGDIDGDARRIDLQTTVSYGQCEPEISDRLKADIRAQEAARKAGRRCAISQFANREIDTGITAYSRSTSRYLRFYHAASGGHPQYDQDVYRGEVEYKNEKASEVWAMYKSAASGEAFAASMVIAELMLLGINEKWFNSAIPATLPVISDIRSDEKTLNWLRTQVMPCITRMCTNGHGAEIDAMFKLARLQNSGVKPLSEVLECQRLREKYFPGRK